MGSLFKTKQETQGTQSGVQDTSQQGGSNAKTTQDVLSNMQGTTASQGQTQSLAAPWLTQGLNNVAGLGNFTQGGVQINPAMYGAANNLGALGAGATVAPAFGAANTASLAGIGDPSRFMSPYLGAVARAAMGDSDAAWQRADQRTSGQQARQGALGNTTNATERAFNRQNKTDADSAMLANLYDKGFQQSGQLSTADVNARLQGAQTAGQLTNTLTGANTAQGQAGQNIFTAGQTNAMLPYLQGQAYSQMLASLGSTLGSQTANTGQTSQIGATNTSGTSEQDYWGKSHGTNSGTTNQTTTNSPSPWQIGMGALGALGSMFSDARIKEGVDGGPPEVIGESYDGQPIYLYSKLGGPPEIGLMAQEVKAEHPEAVGEVGDIMTVNYADALSGARRRPERPVEREAFNGGRIGKENGGGLGATPGTPLGIATGRFSGLVADAYAAIQKMQQPPGAPPAPAQPAQAAASGGKIERPGFALGGWEPTVTAAGWEPTTTTVDGGPPADDAHWDKLVGEAEWNNMGHKAKEYGSKVAGAAGQLGKIGEPVSGDAGKGAMDALARGQQGLASAMQAGDPRNFLPKAAWDGGRIGMYGGGDPDSYDGYADHDFLVPKGIDIDFEPERRAGLGSFERLPEGAPRWPEAAKDRAPPPLPPLGDAFKGVNPGLTPFATRGLDVTPEAPPAPRSNAGLRDVPPPAPRYERDGPPPKDYGFRQGAEDLGKGNWTDAFRGLFSGNILSGKPNNVSRAGLAAMASSGDLVLGKSAANIMGQLAELEGARTADQQARLRLMDMMGRGPSGEPTFEARRHEEGAGLRTAQERAANLSGDLTQEKVNEAQNPMLIYERREAIADRLGLPKGSRERNEFVATGDYPRLATEKESLEKQVAARKAEAERIDMKPDHPAYQPYILTGKMPREDQQPLTATDKKFIEEADDTVNANKEALIALNEGKDLSKYANSGWFAGPRAALGRNLPDAAVPDAMSSPSSSSATAQYQNVVLGNALKALKATFGAAPTEGERQILIDLQASLGLPDADRQKILDRAIMEAQRKLTYNEQKAAALRNKDYYKPGMGQTGAKSVISKMSLDNLKTLLGDKKAMAGLTEEQLREASARYKELLAETPQP